MLPNCLAFSPSATASGAALSWTTSCRGPVAPVSWGSTTGADVSSLVKRRFDASGVLRRAWAAAIVAGDVLIRVIKTKAEINWSNCPGFKLIPKT